MVPRVSGTDRFHCSAFTPSRLDLVKEIYGGPYTTEEVEDVKSFGHIILVLLSQFRILLVDETAKFVSRELTKLIQRVHDHRISRR